MQLRIYPTRLISDVQHDFSNYFPFLKLEFYKSRAVQPDPAKNQPVAPGRKLGEAQSSVADGAIEVEENMKVKELEKIFKDQYKLNVQVFRRSGNLWLQTTMTDDWTLKNQNEHGREISHSETFSLPDADELDAAID